MKRERLFRLGVLGALFAGGLGVAHAELPSLPAWPREPISLAGIALSDHAQSSGLAPLDVRLAQLRAEDPVADKLFLEIDSQRTRLVEQLAAQPMGIHARSDLALGLGRELVRLGHYDDALSVLEHSHELLVVDRATLVFLRAVCLHALQRRDQALAAIETLSAMPGAPRRYLALADRMREQLENLESQSLAGVAHDMRDLHRRLSVKESDEKLLARQKNVLDRLDKLVREAEKKQNNSSSKSKSGSSRSSSPATKSQPLGGRGEGRVDPKTFQDRSSWGALPEKEREKALQEYSRDFPPHYRDVIEEYFRKLAQSQGTP